MSLLTTKDIAQRGIQMNLNERRNKMRGRLAIPPEHFPPSRTPECKPGWVYLLQIADGPTKIGITFDSIPFGRIVRICSHLPYQMILCGLKPSENAAELERELHREFREVRIKGEWFLLLDQELEAICERHGFLGEEDTRNHINTEIRKVIA